MAATKTTTQRGLGWSHQKQRERLIRQHTDGVHCWWCDRPMYRDKDRNWDGLALHADHTQARALGGTKADRLLHGRCNAQRKTGTHDDSRPALTGETVEDTAPVSALGHRAMPWP